VPDWLAVVLLGVIEGVTEFLPVSSTGHLLIAQRWLDPRGDLFNSVVQCGAVLAVVLAFWGRLRELASGWRDPVIRDYLVKLAVAFGITAAGGLTLKALGFKQQDEDAAHSAQLATMVAWVTLVGGFVIIGIEVWQRNRPVRNVITWPVAIVAGLAQLLAVLLPGTSRSAATILSALVLGVKRPVATEFSFLLGVPTLLSAGGLQLVSALKEGESIDWAALLLGSVAATVTAFIAVKWLIRYVQTHTFTIFGWYRIVLGAAILLWGR
jgi:undecaprenyl-diphosphatase